MRKMQKLPSRRRTGSVGDLTFRCIFHLHSSWVRGRWITLSQRLSLFRENGKPGRGRSSYLFPRFLSSRLRARAVSRAMCVCFHGGSWKLENKPDNSQGKNTAVPTRYWSSWDANTQEGEGARSRWDLRLHTYYCVRSCRHFECEEQAQLRGNQIPHKVKPRKLFQALVFHRSCSDVHVLTQSWGCSCSTQNQSHARKGANFARFSLGFSRLCHVS